jgi:mono/diheme cytochrome c family protein
MSAVWKSSPPLRWVFAGVAVAGIAALAVVLWIVLGPGPTDFAGSDRVALSDYHGADPTGVPAELDQASLVRRGEYLTRAGDCGACHSVTGRPALSGGLAFVLPFGTLYSTNITPDKETGIGDWSDAEFLAALRKGTGRNGVHLYPAMPFVSYSTMTDRDGLAIKAYLFSLKPEHAPAIANRLDFPFNQRSLMGVWALLFDRDERFEPHSGQSAEWNRGAYLVETLGHCGECHTPRNLFQALDNRSKFTGAVQAGWRAYNITSDPASGIGAWSDVDLANYLAVGHADKRGSAAGPMGEAVDKSLAFMTHGDIAAMVSYLRSVPPLPSPDLPAPRPIPAPASPKDGVAAGFDPRGKAIFEGACASCHGWTGVSPVLGYATLTGARAVNDRYPVNAAQVILSGAKRTAGGGAEMPAFARFGAAASKIEAADVARLRETQ